MKLGKVTNQKDYEKNAFCILFLIMAVYYGYRMFALTPWYDELYTYYYFVSRGPVYAAIHWPLPNNHVGYSVLSGFLDYLGNPYIGLRGVSYLCSLANLILLYVIGRRYLAKGLALGTVILYISMNLVNQLSVQGRGYTLGVTCFLLATYCVIRIGEDVSDEKKYYVIFGVSLVLGLYAIISNIYWVLSVCFAGGIYLLWKAVAEARKENSTVFSVPSFAKLIKLILTSVAAAVMTIFLYTLIWFAIGSNLLVKDESGQYFGMGHIEVILKAPFKSIGAGIEYMLATPYIQSVEREGFFSAFYEWIQNLLNYYYSSLAMVLLVLILLGIVVVMRSIYRRKEDKSRLLKIFVITGIVCIPVFLTIQCTLPYYRVFMYGGALLAFLITLIMQETLMLIKNEKKKSIWKGGFLTAICVLAVYCFGFCGYGDQYGSKEHEIHMAFEQGNVKEAENLCVTDCNQQYLLKFLYDITCENTQIEGTDYVLFDKKMLVPDYQEMEWEFYHYYSTIPWKFVEENMEPIYETDNYILYSKNIKQ